MQEIEINDDKWFCILFYMSIYIKEKIFFKLHIRKLVPVHAWQNNYRFKRNENIRYNKLQDNFGA